MYLYQYYIGGALVYLHLHVVGPGNFLKDANAS